MLTPDKSLECLESRLLLAVMIHGGVLLGTPGDDEIVVKQRARTKLRIIVNGEKRGFNFSPIRHIHALGGNDRIVLRAADGYDPPDSFYSIDAGTGNDTIKNQLHIDSLYGGDGDDRILAGPWDDHIFAGPGNDKVRAGDGRDVVRGDAGSDRLFGEDDNDLLYGDPNDLLNADAKQKSAQPGSDYISGGDGEDEVLYSGRSADLRLSIDDQRNDGEAGEGDHLHSDVERLTGGAGHDYIVGSDLPNSLVGLHGSDTIFGMGGDDFLAGSQAFPEAAAADFLYGGDGNDLFNTSSGPGTHAYGEAGNDEFIDVGVAARLFGGPGNDRFGTRNNVRDTIDGGLGEDFAIIDELKDSHRSIESGIRPR